LHGITHRYRSIAMIHMIIRIDGRIQFRHMQFNDDAPVRLSRDNFF
jgi:hypothetical protein